MSEGHHNSLAANAGLGAGDSLWQACIDQLAQELPEQQFNTWIKPLVAQVSDDFSRVTLFVANRFKLDWVRAQYSGRIAGMLEKLYGQPVQLELALALRENVSRAYSSPAASEMGSAPVHFPKGWVSSTQVEQYFWFRHASSLCPGCEHQGQGSGALGLMRAPRSLEAAKASMLSTPRARGVLSRRPSRRPSLPSHLSTRTSRSARSSNLFEEMWVAVSSLAPSTIKCISSSSSGCRP
jgi:chromosomal replication initiation ATPase DnaA